MGIPADSLIFIIVTLLYTLVGLVAYRWLLPGIRPGIKGLARFFLVSQILVIGVSLTYEAPTSFEFWLWHLDREWNIPATLASLQLALIGFVALLTAWFAAQESAWRSLYFAALGALFLFLAYDEYAVLHEFIVDWKNYYFVLGGTVIVATLAVAARSAPASRKWYGWLLAGLGASALGGLVVEANCGHQVFMAIDRCDKNFLVEEPLEFAGMWLVLLALLNHLSVLSPRSFARRALYAFPLLWLLLLAISPAIHSIERYAGDSAAAAVEYDSGLRLFGYRFGKNKDSLHLFLSPNRWDFHGTSLSNQGYSVRLLDQVTGHSVVGRDKIAVRHHFLLAPGYMPVYRQWVDINRPATAPENRAFWIVLTLWQEEDDGYPFHQIIASDHQTLSDTEVVLGELVVPAAADSITASADPPAIFDNGFTLADAEWPDRVQAGAILSIDFTWRSNVEGSEDHQQLLHLRHTGSGEWWVFDQMPLGPRLPTRLWYAGLSDSETWQVPLPADMAPGPYSISTGLYRSRDRERVPAQSADGSSFLDGRVPLGSLVVE